jgi:hypothetical protein
VEPVFVILDVRLSGMVVGHPERSTWEKVKELLWIVWMGPGPGGRRRKAWIQKWFGR